MSTDKKKQATRVVLDTNIIISALNFGGKPAEIILLAQRGIIKMFLSSFIIEETHGILVKKFKWQTSYTEQAIRLLQQISHLITPLERLTVIKDEADNRILECALTARANYIVSGDKHLLELKKFRMIKIITVDEFLSTLKLK